MVGAAWGNGVTFLQLIVLAVVQGVTAFLPIGSEAHLLMVPPVTGWSGHGPSVDLAIHVGMLGAVIAYLWRESWAMVVGLWYLFRKRRGGPGVRLIGLMIVGTIPVFGAAYLLKMATGGTGLRSVEVVAWATLVVGILLYAVDKTCLTVRRMEHIGAGSALIIGLSQVLMLLPGAGRAGVTMTAARLIGYERPDAARFSMLLSIPVIVASGVLIGVDPQAAGTLRMGLAAILAAALSFLAALAAMAVMMSWLKRATFAPFAAYRVLLGIFLLIWIYTGWFGGFMPAAMP